MEVVYRANDGKEFDKRTDCEVYERIGRVMNAQYLDFPVVADSLGQIIDLKAILMNQSECNIVTALDSIYYIYANDENAPESYKNLYDLMKDYDCDLPCPERAVYDIGVALYYDDETKEWKDYYELENKFYTLENQFNMMF